jgi:hypothetical protein
MNDILKEIYKECRDVHEKLMRKVLDLKAGFPTDSEKDLADTAFALREAEEHLDAIRKDIKAVGELAEKHCCVKYLTNPKYIANPAKAEPVRTDYCTASPDMAVCASVPTFKKTPEQYQLLMDFLGVDPNCRDQGEIEMEDGTIADTEVLRVHWPGFQSLCTRLQRQGIALPDGINPDATYTLYKLRIRQRKGC